MNWSRFKVEEPELDELVVIWRAQREKYTIGRLKILDEDDGSKRKHWVTEHGSCFHSLDDDAWFPLIPYTTFKEYR